MRSFFSFVQDFIEFRYNLTRQSFRFVSNEKKWMDGVERMSHETHPRLAHDC